MINRMVRVRNSGSSMPMTGIGLGAVAVNTCPVDDQSLFCRVSRLFQIISWIFGTMVMIWVAYIFLDIYVFSKGRGRGKSWF
ncbi:hypothetical protein EBV26_09250 [bacterium]|nr:hypothetical protein [bacterium]